MGRTVKKKKKPGNNEKIHDVFCATEELAFVELPE